ncbi:MAG TPA: two-component regulator propeller domain-containing protein [Chitinophagaceae bacterium]|nr:two-component regulator propeller domain-containing protein [Chitinophagaceae bacterium]
MENLFSSKIILAIYLCICMAKECIAQDKSFPFPAFEKITTEQGLSDNEVFQVMQDKLGFVWLLTGNGLNRFDGYSFKVYDYNPTDSNSITAGLFYSLEQDKNGIFWMNSENQGIYSFNPITGLFFNYRHNPHNKNSLADDLTQGLAIDKNGNIWIATQSGLDKLDPATKQFTHFVHNNTGNISISNNRIYSICIDEDDNLWLATGSPGIDYFNSHTGKLIQHFNWGSSSTPGDDWMGNHPYGVNAGHNGNVWIGSKQQGFYGYNTRTKKVVNFQHEKNDQNSVSDNGVYKIFEDHTGNLWMATDAGMIDYYDKASGKFYHRPLTDNQYVDITEDQGNKIWVTTMNGVYSCDTRFKKIKSLQFNTGKNSAYGKSCWHIFRSRQGQLFVSAQGVNIFDTATGTFSDFKIMEGGKNVFENNITWQVYEDRNNTLWFATILGLISFEPATKKYHWYKHIEGDPTSLSNRSCTSIIEDSKGRYWVTTWGGGFESFDPVSGKFRAFKVHQGGNSISTNSLVGIFENSHGIFYIGSWNGGVITFDPDKEIFKIYRHSANDPNSVSNDIATNFIESKSGIIWFCTSGGGINAFDPATEKFRAFTTKDGLCANSVVSITEDNNGNYWVGTLNGISCFTPPKNPFDPKSEFNFRNYNKSDGLPDNKMSLSAAFKDTDGQIYFGSIDAGLIYFNPAELKDNDYAPPMYLTDFKLFHKSVQPNSADSILKLPIEHSKEIMLSYNQNVISFEFAALNYFHPEKNQYAYRLEGFDKNWVYTDASKRFANYTNLDPGTYTFEVKASNNDGVWNETPTQLLLIITPPFWQTWWFRSLLILAVAAAVYGFYRYRLQHILKLQNIRNKIAADLHDDIGSTLNSISVYSEVAKKDQARQTHALDMIGESSRKVIDAMSDIVWTINPDNDSFEKIILRMRSLCYNLFRAKKIDFVFQAEENLNSLKLSLEERRNFYLIFKEAINNLIKYSGADRVSITLASSSNTIILIIRDNGAGFDITKKYNGNGLINMKKRADEMKAQLMIESGGDTGTNIQLSFKT